MPPIVQSESLLFMTDAALTLGDPLTGNDYAGNCSSIRVDETGSRPVFRGMKPTAIWKGKGQYALTLTFAEDYELDSLWSYLWDNDGKTVPVTFEPVTGGPSFEGTVAIVSGGAGGGQGQVAQSTVVLEMSDRPTLVRA